LKRRSGRPPGATGDLLVLEKLCELGKASVYALSNRSKRNLTLDLEWRAVKNQIEKLSERSYVKIVSRPKSLGRGKEIEYKANVLGLMHLLSKKTPDPECMVRIAKNFGSVLPNILGRWIYFVERKVDCTLLTLIQRVSSVAPLTYPSRMARELYRFERSEPSQGWEILGGVISGELRTASPQISVDDVFPSKILERLILTGAMSESWLLDPSEEAKSLDQRRRLAEAIVSDDGLLNVVMEALWAERFDDLGNALKTESDEMRVLEIRRHLGFEIVPPMPRAVQLMKHIVHDWDKGRRYALKMREGDRTFSWNGPLVSTPDAVRSCAQCDQN
jgi:hypothetical protein